MKFDPENKIHFENVDKNYLHMDILDAINTEAFPPGERIVFADLVALHTLPKLHINAIVDGEVPVGFIVWVDMAEGYNYLAYLAIDPQYRNRKYGSKTMNYLFDNVLIDTVACGVIEALDPNSEIMSKDLYGKDSMIDLVLRYLKIQ